MIKDNEKNKKDKLILGGNLFPLLGSDEKELLSYIESYTPKIIPMETFLEPFLLDYIPAVGDVDTFIKVPRPDKVEDDLGLAVLDEPALEQSDPTILNMKIRNELKDSKNTSAKDVPVKKLERADENIEEIEHWISNIVIYAKPMPNIEHLMQEWPTEVENLLKNELFPKKKSIDHQIQMIFYNIGYNLHPDTCPQTGYKRNML
ncbi:unnamed protein product [Onchocerca flexuosa]|uniref:Intraflagellar transport protein 46 homolog n=1 Tax=Onchocerca flexuosa TaxID=387005 RepID=A0A183HDD6_9BILA|nr:unnamed protein product [Onchocerca flexuosa]